MKPWHMVPEHVRCGVLSEMVIAETAALQYGDAETAAAYVSARRALADAAPYPDEALVYELGGNHYVLADIETWDKPTAWVLLLRDGEFREWSSGRGFVTSFRPLTIAAAEALEMFGGGK